MDFGDQLWKSKKNGLTCVGNVGVSMHLLQEKKCTALEDRNTVMQGRLQVQSPRSTTQTERRFLERSMGARSPPRIGHKHNLETAAGRNLGGRSLLQTSVHDQLNVWTKYRLKT